MTSAKTLSERELEILKLIYDGFTNKEISKKLGISEYTVETHRKNINNKLGTNNTATMLRKAKDNGLV